MSQSEPAPGTEPTPRRRVLSSPAAKEARFLADVLRQETVGGAVLLVTAVVAVAWANSP